MEKEFPPTVVVVLAVAVKVAMFRSAIRQNPEINNMPMERVASIL